MSEGETHSLHFGSSQHVNLDTQHSLTEFPFSYLKTGHKTSFRRSHKSDHAKYLALGLLNIGHVKIVSF